MARESDVPVRGARATDFPLGRGGMTSSITGINFRAQFWPDQCLLCLTVAARGSSVTRPILLRLALHSHHPATGTIIAPVGLME
jgi:hypothetical protein